ELEQLILKHQVVVFRDQDLDPLQQIAVCKQFGEIEPHPLKTNTCPYSEMTIVSNVSEDGESVGYPGPEFELWHSDMCYSPAPPKFSFLYAERVPPVGGNTLFANCYAAYDTLDPQIKEFLEGKLALFGFSEKLMERCRALGYPLEIAEEDQQSDVSHPVFRKHPITQRKAVFVNWTHTDSILGVDEKQSAELLDLIHRHTTRSDRVYSHRYRPRDLIVWDNSSTLHTGDGTVAIDRPRVMRRVVVRF
ncbi:MAG: TauD/TfdA family dioxygenase, partial [Chlamydiia bacterium]|nr:TauD/TfdA family dioxygenase [Chlamydiia bacterium]